MPEFSAGTKLTAEKLSRKGVKLWGRRTSNSSASTGTETSVLRLDDAALKALRHIVVQVSGIHLESSVVSDALKVQIRYTTDASTPTTSSTVLPGSVLYGREVVANSSETTALNVSYETGSSDETLSVLLTVTRIAGTGNCILHASSTDCLDMRIVDVGPAVGNTGTAL